MKKILIIGATSSIAQATARIWAKEKSTFFLVARDQERLDAIAIDLKVRGAQKVVPYLLDVNDFEEHQNMIDVIFDTAEKIDIALIAHGSLSNQKCCENSVSATIHELNTNAISIVSLLTILANQFEKQKMGVITIIGSVAGDRGRQSNYVYGSAKALIASFASGLRQRMFKHGVSVVLIKPGFVDTPMTSKLKKGLLWSTPERIAKVIASSCKNQNKDIYAPKFWNAIMAIIKMMPTSIFVKLNL